MEAWKVQYVPLSYEQTFHNCGSSTKGQLGWFWELPLYLREHQSFALAAADQKNPDPIQAPIFTVHLHRQAPGQVPIPVSTPQISLKSAGQVPLRPHFERIVFKLHVTDFVSCLFLAVPRRGGADRNPSNPQHEVRVFTSIWAGSPSHHPRSILFVALLFAPFASGLRDRAPDPCIRHCLQGNRKARKGRRGAW
jgi:hypothetical protein